MGKAKTLCVDASVALKWFFDDEESATHARLILRAFTNGRLRLIVPDLFFYEVANGITIAVRRQRMSPEDALTALESLELLKLNTFPAFTRKAEAVFAVSHRFSLSFYDASYIVTSEHNADLLVTADERLWRAVNPALPYVRLLGQSDLTEEK